ncbi:uncharacterized protein EV422DRAFT_581211 [Fimicolochytrium jonesii]|uniref:uncharacterized protein n=1 Tax=Fimicolochytrium jonesii TaxID=1396493 RepID=UPI0022FE5C9B|nr:uncharacterized protein EV422DRAFT_581211 [Fimicolochytrium jonesii]KAI8816667.1 hypothetical protein EV422DRAFT_581211 [Fimicolochytrium jonesii]
MDQKQSIAKAPAMLNIEQKQRVLQRLRSYSSPFFANGATLADELAFVSWYHRSPQNRALHVCSVGLGFAFASTTLAPLPIARMGVKEATATAVRSSRPSALVFGIPAIYTAYFTNLFPETLIPATAYMGAVGLGAAAMYKAAQRVRPVNPFAWAAGAATCSAIAFAAQGQAHVVFEGKQPALRIFEAAVTAPFATVLWLSSYLGWSEGREILNQVETLSQETTWQRQFIPAHDLGLEQSTTDNTRWWKRLDKSPSLLSKTTLSDSVETLEVPSTENVEAGKVDHSSSKVSQAHGLKTISVDQPRRGATDAPMFRTSLEKAKQVRLVRQLPVDPGCRRPGKADSPKAKGLVLFWRYTDFNAANHNYLALLIEYYQATKVGTIFLRVSSGRNRTRYGFLALSYSCTSHDNDDDDDTVRTDPLNWFSTLAPNINFTHPIRVRLHQSRDRNQSLNLEVPSLTLEGIRVFGLPTVGPKLGLRTTIALPGLGEDGLSTIAATTFLLATHRHMDSARALIYQACVEDFWIRCGWRVGINQAGLREITFNAGAGHGAHQDANHHVGKDYREKDSTDADGV